MEKDLKRVIIEEAVLEKARELSEDSLAILTKEYYPVIFRYFYYRVRTKEDAEDLASEVFMRMVGSIRLQKGNFGAWLFQIAKNLLIDYYRKKGRSREISLNGMKKPLPAPDKDKRDNLYPEDFKKILEFLTDEQKEVITLKFIEDYANEEIAKIMNKSIGAVKSLQFRALSVLRDVLKEKGCND